MKPTFPLVAFLCVGVTLASFEVVEAAAGRLVTGVDASSSART